MNKNESRELDIENLFKFIVVAAQFQLSEQLAAKCCESSLIELDSLFSQPEYQM